MIRLGICGVGTVGAGTINLLNQNAEHIAQRLGSPLEISLVGARRDSNKCDLSSLRVTRDVIDVAEDPDVDLVVELIGGTKTAFEVISKALNNHKHVVTANKALIAEHGEELARLAQTNNCLLKFEATVAAGVPIIETLCSSLAANSIQQVTGIINGTCNFILTSMTKNQLGFDQALEQAQQNGYAEDDPSFDIDGIDAAHKLTILASLAFGTHLNYYNVVSEGISSIESVDVISAGKLGYVIKHLGIARLCQVQDKQEVEMRVHPALIPGNNILAQVDGATNALMVDSTPLGQSMYIGEGAGAGATASAVVSDIIAIARASNPSHTYPPLAFQPSMRNQLESRQPDNMISSNYIRLNAIEKPGILAQITKVFAEENNSIKAIVQQEIKPAKSSRNPAIPIVMLTKSIEEYRIRRIITRLEQLDEVNGKVQRIRLEHLGQPDDLSNINAS